jgi:hypothetical protein
MKRQVIFSRNLENFLSELTAELHNGDVSVAFAFKLSGVVNVAFSRGSTMHGSQNYVLDSVRGQLIEQLKDSDYACSDIFDEVEVLDSEYL